MDGAFHIAATGLRSQQRALEIVANNIANMNTPGFKRSEARFSELMAARSTDVDEATTVPDMAGVAVAAPARIYVQGDLKPTGKASDLAIDGPGFIELLGPAGKSLLWRGGALKVNADGFLAASNGMPLKAMISAPLGVTDLAIAADGKVTGRIDGQTAVTVLGQIDLALAKDTGLLVADGDGLYRTQSEGDLVNAVAGEDGAGVFVQGSIEGSNVQLSDEMVTLLLMQRAFSANAQVVQAGDQLMSIINGLKR